MKNFITVCIWQETKNKLEQVRISKAMKEKKMISLAQVIDELVDDYLNENNTNNKH